MPLPRQGRLGPPATSARPIPNQEVAGSLAFTVMAHMDASIPCPYELLVRALTSSTRGQHEGFQDSGPTGGMRPEGGV